MPKNEDDLRARLRTAALELFRERGYDRTTAAGIAARTGVTERTFFRHFPDKREVLFEGEAVIRAALTASVESAPDGLGTLELLLRAFRSLRSAHEANEAYLRLRREVIAASPALRERELAKMASVAEALADALKARGVAELRAILAAWTSTAAFFQAAHSWLDDPGGDFSDRLDLAFRELRSLFAEDDP